jgi:hypothetical protein
MLRDECAFKLNKLEEYYRKLLLQKRLYTESALPAAVHPMSDLPSKAITITAKSGEVDPAKAEGTESGGQGARKLGQGPADTLTEAHVYDRLGVKGCGEEVMAFVNIGGSSNVKQEISDVSDGLVNVAEGSQPSVASWRKVRLISVSLPEAVVLVIIADEPHRISVCVDELRAVSKLDLPKVIVHPSLRDAGVTLDPYDYDFGEKAFTQVVAEHMLQCAHASVQACVEHVGVSVLSDQGKLPLTLQVRALQPFKKGTLMLVPVSAEVLPEDDEAGRTLARTVGAVHLAMMSQVQMKVIAASTADRRHKNITTRTSPFVIRSPLLDFKIKNKQEGCLENVAPFWAVLRCSAPKACHNMEIDTVLLHDAGFDVKGGQFGKMPKCAEFCVEIPILRNVSHISKGDVLCLPFSAF